MGHALRLAAANDEASPRPRGGSRSRVLLAAIVRNAFGEQPVKIRDISETGAMIQAPIVPQVGSRLLLSRGTVSVTATVVWAESGKYGVHFQEGVDVAALLVPVACAKTPAAPQPLKAIFPVLDDAEKPGLDCKSKH